MASVFRVRPSDNRATAYRAFESILKRDAALRALGVVWTAPETEPAQSPCLATDRPSIEMEPEWLDLEPMCLLGHGQVSYEAPIQVNLRIRTPGVDGVERINLWGLIEAAVYRPDSLTERNRVWAEMAAAGVNNVETVRPPGPTADDPGSFRIITYVLG